MTPAVESRKTVWTGWDALIFFSPLALLFVVPALMAKPGMVMKPSLAGLWLEYGVFALWFGALALWLRVRYETGFWRAMEWNVPWPAMWMTLSIGPPLALGVSLLGAALKAQQIDPLQELVYDLPTAVLLGVFAVLVGPLAEELMFRGFLLPLTVKWAGPLMGTLLCATPFALLHGPQYQWSWQHIVLLIGASSLFGWVRLRTGSTAAAAAVHAGYNLVFYVGYVIQRKDPLF